MVNRRDDLVIGRQPVLEALKQGRPEKILMVAGQRGASVDSILKLARGRRVPVRRIPRSEFERVVGPLSGCQGVAALVKPFAYLSLDALLSGDVSFQEPPCLVLLDHLQDPQNLGAIIRTAYFAGAEAVIIPRRRAAPITPAARKAAAGAAEKLPVVQVSNMVQTMGRLKQEGYWVYGAEADGDLPFYQADYGVPLALVLGSEGKGLSPLVRRHCDQILYIPMGRPGGSLNVSVAAAILMFTASGRRQGWY